MRKRLHGLRAFNKPAEWRFMLNSPENHSVGPLLNCNTWLLSPLLHWSKWCSLIVLCISHAIAAGFTWRPTLKPSHLVQIRPQIHIAEFSLSLRQLFQAAKDARNGNTESGVCEIVLHGVAGLQEMPPDTGGGSRLAPQMQSDALQSKCSFLRPSFDSSLRFYI